VPFSNNAIKQDPVPTAFQTELHHFLNGENIEQSAGKEW
jgi:hypothetical protein